MHWVTLGWSIDSDAKGDRREALWRSYCTDPVVAFMVTTGVRVAAGFAKGFENASAARGWLAAPAAAAATVEMMTMMDQQTMGRQTAPRLKQMWR